MTDFVPGDLAYLPERAVLYDEKLHICGRLEKPELVIVLSKFEKDVDSKRNLLKILNSKKSFFVRKNDLKRATDSVVGESNNVSQVS